MLLPMVARAETVEIDGIYYYILSSDEVEVIQGTNEYTGDVVIPETITYRNEVYKVARIGSFAFRGDRNLKSVSLPEGLTEIRYGAFQYCSSLTYIFIPQGVNYIYQKAFEGCSSLTTVLFYGQLERIEDSVFKDCTSLTSIVLPEGMWCIHPNAFRDCISLSEIYIPKSMRQISTDAFQGCTELKKVIISDIDSWCKISFSNVESNPLHYAHHLYDDNGTEIKELILTNRGGYYLPCIKDYAFYDAEGIEKIYIICPDIPYIADNAFGKTCYTWTDLYVPAKRLNAYKSNNMWMKFNSISGYRIIADSIEYRLNSDYDSEITVVKNDDYLYSGDIVIPDSITFMGKTLKVTSVGTAFKDCTGLNSIVLPNSVKQIGSDSFSGCSGMTSVVIPQNLTSINERVFYGCSSLTSVTIPNSVISIGEKAFANCSSLTSVTIPNSVIGIGEKAFYDCSNLTSVTIPNSVTSIGRDIFQNCFSLISVTIPNSVTRIEGGAFYGCSCLTNITIPNSVNYIGEYAFLGCTGLTSLTIPNSVNYIGERAFSGCTGLTSIIIPNSVTSFGIAFLGSAFLGCSALYSIVVESGNTVYDSRDNCNAIIHTSTNTLLSGCKATTIPNSVTTIENYAFSGHTGLTNIIIPNSVTSIGYGAFEDCNNLASVTIGSNVSFIGNAAFSSPLKSIVTYNTTPPVLDGSVFVSYNETILKVPIGSKMAYQNAKGWNLFYHIEEFDPSGIQGITLDKKTNTSVYDLNGRRLTEPAKGINIIGGKKVLNY